jgi:hypothetical protein
MDPAASMVIVLNLVVAVLADFPLGTTCSVTVRATLSVLTNRTLVRRTDFSFWSVVGT